MAVLGVVVLIASRGATELDRARALSDNDSPMERDLRTLFVYVEMGLLLVLLLSLSASAPGVVEPS